MRTKKIGTIVCVECVELKYVKVYGEIIDNTKTADYGNTIYVVKLDNGDTMEFNDYQVVSVTKGNEGNHNFYRNGLKTNPLNILGEDTHFSFAVWEDIIESLPLEKREKFGYISKRIQAVKDVYKIK
jgi:hypothetical protein